MTKKSRMCNDRRQKLQIFRPDRLDGMPLPAPGQSAVAGNQFPDGAVVIGFGAPAENIIQFILPLMHVITDGIARFNSASFFQM